MALESKCPGRPVLRVTALPADPFVRQETRRTRMFRPLFIEIASAADASDPYS
jgi:hypothetical protein